MFGRGGKGDGIVGMGFIVERRRERRAEEGRERVEEGCRCIMDNQGAMG